MCWRAEHILRHPRDFDVVPEVRKTLSNTQGSGEQPSGKARAHVVLNVLPCVAGRANRRQRIELEPEREVQERTTRTQQATSPATRRISVNANNGLRTVDTNRHWGDDGHKGLMPAVTWPGNRLGTFKTS
eukprot:COSAG02_NODE_4581_length_5196_cov_11.016676_1_plen_129_part_10